MSSINLEDFEATESLTKDIRTAGTVVGRDEARELVDLYYRLQEERIKLRNQGRALKQYERPDTIVTFFGDQITRLEKNMVSVLDDFSSSQAVGVWSKAQMGIGPVLAAGFLAHIDITKSPTVGHIWRFAGLDPSQKWLGKIKAASLVKERFPLSFTETEVRALAVEYSFNPDTIWRVASTDRDGKARKVTATTIANAFARRPWNADLKVLCWKAGDSFVKQSGREKAFYGRMYKERKQYEVARDESGGNANTAADTLLQKSFKDMATKKIYESGHLPAGRLELRARRWAVKLFLSHWHHVAYVSYYGTEPPKPYILTQEGGHAHYIAPPGLTEECESTAICE